MLEALSIKGVVLIDHLELRFSPGFTVLTGETGAGKSILLEALGLALGERASTQLLNPRHSCASVSAVFRLAASHPLHALLKEHDLEAEDSLILRRVLTSDGKSRAYINDQSVSLSFLRAIGCRLVEIHGQFDRLLDPKTHLTALDRFANLEAEQSLVRQAFQDLRAARHRFEEVKHKQAKSQDEQDFLRHAVDELQSLALKEKEEEALQTERAFLQNHARISENVQAIFQKLYADRGVAHLLSEAVRLAHKVVELGRGRFENIKASLEQALTEIEEIKSTIAQALRPDVLGNNRLETIEDRLFTLRTVARKYGVAVSALPDLLQQFQTELTLLSKQDEQLEMLEKNMAAARQNFIRLAQALHQQRQHASQQLETALKKELVPLKLEKATVQMTVDKLPEPSWNETGIDQVEFQIQPNPGMALGPLVKIASGGERSRFMLALKVILAKNPDMSLLIFDEIDAGVGGAVASAIGERMARLGQEMQVFAITHAPQVAACADAHWVVSKKVDGDVTLTEVHQLNTTERLEEIARMLSGEQITTEARAAAAQLLNLRKDAA
jgi:DNA repair protein RecN (Recombination protein N)